MRRLVLAIFVFAASTSCNVSLLDPNGTYPCTFPTDCTEGYQCLVGLDKNGYCTVGSEYYAELDARRDLITELECLDVIGCPSGLDCHPLPGWDDACRERDGGCVCMGPDAWTSMEANRTNAVTDVPCDPEWDCGVDMECQADDDGNDRCIGTAAAEEERQRRNDEFAGKICEADSDCGPLVCQADDQAKMRCISEDEAEAERAARAMCPSECPAGEACHTELLNGDDVGFCRAACDPFTSDSACEAWEVCDVFLGWPALGTCSLPCDGDDDCIGGRLCDTDTGTCGCATAADCDYEGYTCDQSVGRCAPTCASDNECGCGSLCESGVCSAGCSDDLDCCSGSVCSNGHCTVPQMGQGVLGARCANASHCSGALFCNVSQGGFCHEPANCNGDDSVCSSDSECATYRGFRDGIRYRSCLPACAADDDCHPNEVCSQEGRSTRKVCVPRCDQDVDCGDRDCDVATGQCVCNTDSQCKTVFGEAAFCESGNGPCLCTPDCSNKTCGDDGCGGSCGGCPRGEVCSDQFACTTRANFCSGPEPDIECEGERGHWCPANSTCTYANDDDVATGCSCIEGFEVVHCDGTACDGGCSAPDYRCDPM